MTALLAAAVLLQIQVREEPKDWNLIQTANFNVYYPSDALLPRAREFAAWFEAARTDLIAQVGVAPRRVNVFLYRSFHDLQQSSYLGDARPLHRRIREPVTRESPPRRECSTCRLNPRSRALALAEPLRDRIFIHCQASDRWNYWFARHELAHHVQFEHFYPLRLPSWLLALKNPLLPAWFMEGGADYLAGVDDPTITQFVRDLAEEGFYDLKELHAPDILNSYDHLAIYYQGSTFWRFLDEAYGKSAVRRLFDRTDHGLPLASQKPLQFAVGKNRVEVEREFAEHVRARWAPVMAGRTVPGDRITDSALAYYRRRSWGGRYSPDGKSLAWISNENLATELMVDGRGMLGWDRSVDGSQLVSPPSWSPDGKRIAVIEWRTNRDLLLLVDVDGGSQSIELPFDEVYDPAWAPDGDRIAFSGLKNGSSDLYLLHLSDRRIERLTEDISADSAPAWSKDGKLAWIKETEGRTVLHVQGQGPVTKSWALLEYPQWSPDGRSIVVAADVEGVFDAFAVDPATGRAKRLTRFRGGVSYPAHHPDGSLVITYFQRRGLDLFRVRSEPQDEAAFDQEDRKPWYDRFKKPEPQGQPAEKSRVWGIDYFMFPVQSQSLLSPGVEFVFGDRDGENTLALAGFAVAGDYWGGSATVANTRWRPTIGVVAAGARTGDFEELRAQPFIDLPIWKTLAVTGGWVARERTQHDDDFPDASFFDSGPFMGLLYTNQKNYHARDPAWGLSFGATATFFREDLGGDRDQDEYFAFGETSIALAQDWIFWTRVTWEKLDTVILLRDELLDLEAVVRGSDEREGIERGVVSTELRFPIWRDFLWKPLELIGLGEWLILKDLRGFAFGQAGYAGLEFEHAWDDDFGVASAGLGLRLDLSFMLWPIVNGRVPVRLEGWWAIVGEDDKDARGEVGFGFQLGY